MDDRVDMLKPPAATKGSRPSVSVSTNSHEKRRFQTAGMREFLSQFRGKPIFYRPNPGNAGDSIIHVGTEQALRRAGVPMKMLRQSSLIDGDTVFLGGGGNLVPLYAEARDFLLNNNVLDRVAQLVILPHTIRGNEDLLEKMDSRVTIFCRDPISYDHVSRYASTPNVYLDHDMATHIDIPTFYVDTIPYIDVPDLYKHVMQKAGGEIRLNNAGIPANFMRTDGETANRKLPSDNLDISKLFEFGTWPENAHKAAWCFFEAIRQSSHVTTDRLHVAVACSLLDKPCTFLDNSYGKNATIFRHSIRKYSSCIDMVEIG
jgi:exopolysaccharide biosynthesis predicted pyruvyltransferase EpsI